MRNCSVIFAPTSTHREIMPSSTAKNLEAIDAAVKQHRERCTGELVAILMSPFEVERLGWDDYLGIPIRAEEMGTGRFRLVCERDLVDQGENVEAREIAQPVTRPVPGVPLPATA